MATNPKVGETYRIEGCEYPLHNGVVVEVTKIGFYHSSVSLDVYAYVRPVNKQPHEFIEKIANLKPIVVQEYNARENVLATLALAGVALWGIAFVAGGLVEQAVVVQHWSCPHVACKLGVTYDR